MRKGTRGTQGPCTKVGHVAMGCQPARRDEKQPMADMFALLAALLARITRTQTCHVWQALHSQVLHSPVAPRGSTTAASASDTPLVGVDYPRSDGVPRLCPHHHPGRVGRALPDVRAPGRGGRDEPRTRTRPSPTASPGSSGRESRLDTCVMGVGPAGPAVVNAPAERNLPYAHLVVARWARRRYRGYRQPRRPDVRGRRAGVAGPAGAAGVAGPGTSGLAPLCLACAVRLSPAATEGGLARLILFNCLGVITGCAVSGLLGSTGRFRLACAAQAALAPSSLAAARRSSLHNSAWIRGTP